MSPFEAEKVEVQQTQQSHQITPILTSWRTPHNLCSHENKTCSNPGQALQQGQLSKLMMKMTSGFLAFFKMPAQVRVAKDDQHAFAVAQMVDLDAIVTEQTNLNFAQDAPGANALALVLLVTPRRLKVLLRNLIQAW